MNEGTFFEGGVNLNPEFSEMRNRGKTNFKISSEAKRALEKSILASQDYSTEQPYRTENKANFACTVDGLGANLGENEVDKEVYPPDSNKP